MFRWITLLATFALLAGSLPQPVVAAQSTAVTDLGTPRAEF